MDLRLDRGSEPSKAAPPARPAWPHGRIGPSLARWGRSRVPLGSGPVRKAGFEAVAELPPKGGSPHKTNSP